MNYMTDSRYISSRCQSVSVDVSHMGSSGFNVQVFAVILALMDVCNSCQSHGAGKLWFYHSRAAPQSLPEPG